MPASLNDIRGDAAGIGAVWAGFAPLIGFGDGRIHAAGRFVQVHDGGMLAMLACPSRQAAISAGDDGRLVRTDGAGKSKVLLDTGGGWLDCLAVAQDTGDIAVAAGRTVHVLRKGQAAVQVRLDRAAGAMALSADGTLLAAAHGAGVTIHDLAGGPARECSGAGGHVSVAFSPDGRFVVAGTAEPALAGWRIADGQGFKMANFPGKPMSFAWVDGGDALVTSGGPALLAWPFHGLNGPMGEAAGVYRPRLGLCTAVAAQGHFAAAGWSDGGVDLFDLGAGSSIHVAGPAPAATLEGDPRESLARVSGLAFSPNGKRLAWCREDGLAGVAKV